VPGDIECTSATEKQCNALGSAALLWERLRFLNYLPSKTDQGIPVNSTYTMPFPDGAYVPTADNPGPGAWESLVYVKEDYHHGPVNGNRGGSYLTMLSEGGLSFGVVNIVGNFGTVFVDQSYWQSAIAARPSSAHRGYLLGGLVWFTIPMSLATALGLSSLALNVKMPADEAADGLAPPAAAIVLLGQGGGIMIIIMLFMARASTHPRPPFPLRPSPHRPPSPRRPSPRPAPPSASPSPPSSRTTSTASTSSPTAPAPSSSRSRASSSSATASSAASSATSSTAWASASAGCTASWATPPCHPSAGPALSPL